MRKLAFAFTVLASTTAALLACSSSTTTSSGSDAGTPAPDSGGGDSGGGGDGGATINGCTTFTDHTATSDARGIAWSLATASDPNRCMTIKVGQSVKWTGSFVSHPLGAQGGTTPNPITSSGATTDDAGQSSATIAFPSAGNYGYVCAIHASMTGVIQVVP